MFSECEEWAIKLMAE